MIVATAGIKNRIKKEETLQQKEINDNSFL